MRYFFILCLCNIYAELRSARDWSIRLVNKRAVLFTYQHLSPNSRKTGMLFIADALASSGFDTKVVTVQLSLFTYFSRHRRTKSFNRGDLLTWRDRGERLKAYVWLAAVHPLSFGASKAPFIGRWLAKIYPWMLPRTVMEEVRRADIIVIESCVAVCLFDHLKRRAPSAKFLYCASDRLSVAGMHPYLEEILNDTASKYDLIRIPAEAMKGDFPSSANVQFLPHGLDKSVFDAATESPYAERTVNAVVAGDMNSDTGAIRTMASAFPDVVFHVFGKLHFAAVDLPNVVNHGEVAFSSLATFIRHADVGIAPYKLKEGAEYLSQSSLKMIQYTYCRLPIVAPFFAKNGRDHVCGYDGSSIVSIRNALTTALEYDRSKIDHAGITTWNEVVSAMLENNRINIKPRSHS